MAIADDISVATNGDIRYTGSTANYTVLELHRYLQDLADQAAASGNDLVDITSANPSERSTDNIITLLGTYNIDDALAEHLYDGSITQASGDVLYSGLVVVGNVFGTTTLQVVQNNTLYDTDTPFWGTGINVDVANNILSRMLIKTRTAGADIDGKRIRVFAREWGETYAEFSVTMGLGNSVAAIFTLQDLNNATASGTVATWTTISNTEGYQTIDLNNGDGQQPYYSQWNRDIYTINQLYERAKYIVRRGTAETIHTMDGELFRGITHQLPWTAQTITDTFDEDEILSWGTGATAGTGRILADSEAGVDAGQAGTSWIQLLTGIPPTNGLTLTGGTSTVTATCGTPVARSLSSMFLGTSTGSALIGAYGIGVEPTDLSKDDKLFDLSNTQRIPPNNVTFTVYSVVSAEDYVLIGPEDGSGGLDYDQMTLNTTLNGATETSVVVTTAIPADTPTTGTIRIQLDTGIYRKVSYTSWTGSTFIIPSTNFTDPNDATAPRNVFITYIDTLADAATEAFTTKYSADRTLFIRVRDGGGTPIKSFETTGTLNTAGGSATAIRTTDA